MAKQRGSEDRPRLILASASPRRRELLAALGVPFEIVASNIEEPMHGHPSQRAGELALEKARAVAENAHSSTAVLGADTVVVLDGDALGKPGDPAEARFLLERLRGRTHEVVTAVAVVHDRREQVARVSSRVTMRDYDSTAVERFIASGEPFDKAGGYAVQNPDFRPVARLDGCECAVIGLPLWTTRRLLTEVAGIEAPPPPSQRCEGCPERR